MENSSDRLALPSGWKLRPFNRSGLSLLVAVTPDGIESLRTFATERAAIEAAVDVEREAAILRAARRFEREIEAIDRREAAEAEAARS
jgi:hypothetical protein